MDDGEGCFTAILIVFFLVCVLVIVLLLTKDDNKTTQTFEYAPIAVEQWKPLGCPDKIVRYYGQGTVTQTRPDEGTGC